MKSKMVRKKATKKKITKKETSKKSVKKKRPRIPDDVKLELWARAGGRCQYRGCNKQVWRDGLTLATLNRSNIAHIISWTPTGPRGDKVRSELLAKNIKNLMLTCQKHNTLIDKKKYVPKHPEKLLLAFKQEHEERIEIVTDIKSSNKTELLIFKANIGDRIIDIDPGQAASAALPFYPTRENPFTIDLTKMSSNTTNYWVEGFQTIKEKVERFMSRDVDRSSLKHISIFALGPIPFLIKLGKLVGDIIPIRLFQNHRTTNDWIWNDSKFKCPYKKRVTKSKGDARNIALIFSLSGKIHKREYKSFLTNTWEIIEISILNPNVLFLKNESQIVDFRIIYRSILADIRTRHGDKVKVHIFPAVPAPIAVEIGCSILPKSDPRIYLYDKNIGKTEQFIKVGEL